MPHLKVRHYVISMYGSTVWRAFLGSPFRLTKRRSCLLLLPRNAHACFLSSKQQSRLYRRHGNKHRKNKIRPNFGFDQDFKENRRFNVCCQYLCSSLSSHKLTSIYAKLLRNFKYWSTCCGNFPILRAWLSIQCGNILKVDMYFF